MTRKIELIYWKGKYYDLKNGKPSGTVLFTLDEMNVYSAETLLDDIILFPKDNVSMIKIGVELE